MSLVDRLDVFRSAGTRRRFPKLPPSLPISPLEQTWRFASDLANLLEDANRTVGATFTLDIPSFGPIVSVSREEDVRAVVSGASDDFGSANDAVAFFVGPSSILLLEGDAHASARARTLSAFAGERMRGYGPAIHDSVTRYIDALRPGQRISAIEAGQSMALDIILRALFGLSSGPEYQRLYDCVTSFMAGGHTPVATLMSMYLQPDVVRRLVSGTRDPVTMRLVAGSSSGLAARIPGIREGRELLDALLDLIEQRKARLDDEGSDALGYILRKARDSGQPYGAEQALDEALTLLLAGHDTTAITLSWALYRLARAPAVVSAMREELAQSFPDGAIDTRTIERLPFLRAVLDECFRLDGLGRGVGRRLKRDMRLGGYDIPAGTLVQAYTYCNNRDPKRWDFPDDFVPSQFVGKRPKPFEFTPFGGGYRRCVGAAFAEYELKILLAEIVRRVDFTFPEGMEVRTGMLGPMIAPVGPVPIDVVAIRS